MFFFRTHYTQTNRDKSTSQYASYVLAENEEEALHKMSVRNLGEEFYSFIPPTLEMSKDIINIVALYDKGHYKHCLHALTFVVYVLSQAEMIDAKDTLADTGIVHEMIHFITGAYSSPVAWIREELVHLQALFESISH